MIVNIHLVLHVEIDQDDEDQEKHEGYLKCKEGDQ